MDAYALGGTDYEPSNELEYTEKPGNWVVVSTSNFGGGRVIRAKNVNSLRVSIK